MSSRKQVSHILNKFFNGHQSTLSVPLLTEAMELHYEGFNGNLTELVRNSIVAMISECGRDLHRNELQKMLKEVSENRVIEREKKMKKQHI